MRHLTFDVQMFAVCIEDQGAAIRMGDLRALLPDDLIRVLGEPFLCSCQRADQFLRLALLKTY